METNIEFKKILIAVDASSYSEKAAKYGCTLAKTLQAQIAFIHVDEYPVVTEVTGDAMMGEQMLVLPDITEIQNENAKNLLHKMTQTYADGLEAEQIIKTGMIKDEILQFAKEWKADVIVLGTHGRTGFDHLILGSMAESITRHAECPVLIIPNKTEDKA